jgi:hypothetical protein
MWNSPQARRDMSFVYIRGLLAGKWSSTRA